jgi:hypothetical protein
VRKLRSVGDTPVDVEAAMTTTEPLSEREQWALEQMREAQDQGATLKAHAAKIGIDVGQLYDLRRRLVRKGAFGAPLPRKARKSSKAGVFVPVRIIPSTAAQSGPSLACRLLHPSGWVFECDGLPPSSWIAEVLAGGTHAAS